MSYNLNYIKNSMDTKCHTSEHTTVFVEICIFEVQYYTTQVYAINWSDSVTFAILFHISGHNALQHWQQAR